MGASVGRKKEWWTFEWRRLGCGGSLGDSTLKRDISRSMRNQGTSLIDPEALSGLLSNETGLIVNGSGTRELRQFR